MAEHVAFMSYVHSDDQHEGGRLTAFRERLASEVSFLTGQQFSIFQDRNDIAWGQSWRQRIEDSIDFATFFIPIITPRYFQSGACRGELEQFLLRERSLRRNDLVLPIYYVTSDQLEDSVRRSADPLAQAIADHQFEDWRELRHEPFDAPVVRKRFERLAEQLASSLRSAGTTEVSPDGDRTRVSRGDKPGMRTEPPLLIVGDGDQAHVRTIGEAIARADPGTRILVLPGIYKEGLFIDKPLEIIGEGSTRDAVAVEAEGSGAVVFATTLGRIANMTIRQVAGGGDFFAVDVAQGRLDLEECDISTETLSCVAIRGGADPRLRRNLIHNAKHHGVLITENSLGTFEDNEIFDNAMAGVAIRRESNPVLRHNKIRENHHHGVYVIEQSLGTLEDNEIFGNAFPGVTILQGSSPMLRRNRIHKGRQHGVYIAEQAAGTLEDNELYDNAYPGLVILQESNPEIRRNRIHGNRDHGVWIAEHGNGTLEDNEIFGNENAGIYIIEQSNPVVRRNRIVANGGRGIDVEGSGSGTIEGNVVGQNAKNKRRRGQR